MGTAPVLTVCALLFAALATVAIGAYGVRMARTTSDFLVASRSVGPRWNAAAISGEYLSAASFLGVAGLIAKYGADALWYPVGFTAGYLGLLLFVAAPLRRSGAYTVPDFAEFRLGSVRLRRLAAVVAIAIAVSFSYRSAYNLYSGANQEYRESTLRSNCGTSPGREVHLSAAPSDPCRMYSATIRGHW